MIKPIGSWSFRTKLLISNILLIVIPVIFISAQNYNSSLKVVSDMAAKNAYQIIKNKNEILDSKLIKVQESSLALMQDKELFELFNNVEEHKKNILSMDRKIGRIINNYFAFTDYVYAVQMATSYYIFGSNFNMLVGSEFVKSDLYKRVVNEGGKMFWVPTYDFVYMFEHKNMGTANFDVRNVFSAARLFNIFCFDNGVFSILNPTVERPVLIIHFKEDIIRDVFQDSIPIKDTVFYMIDASGNVVSHIDQALVGKQMQPEWLSQALKNKTGSIVVGSEGNKKIVCYDTSGITGWIAVAEIPMKELTRSIVPSMIYSILSVSAFFIGLALLLAFVISQMITKPIERLTAGMKRIGNGNFDMYIPVERKDELGYLTAKFNDMNHQIKTLIEENYAVKLREKETEIMALNLQMNPHFLYNTLNIINWMAIEDGNKNISDMLINLCDMLVYTVRNKQDIVNFEDDLKWLQCYLFIMSVRYENKFKVEFDIEPEIYLTKVPKLFLQPFVENAIIHGFERMESEGLIRIRGYIDNCTRHFQIEDNGKGMDTAVLMDKRDENNTSIGISNVDRRIKLLFGQEYGVKIASDPGHGTLVNIILPL
ncbi:hypothetical protein CDQ84_09610 [Clostridium thermosuccinogenes]|uniref:HAMP domain-containing protein n=1 Tax=Clostridium thermosuccinogenes TaxID=84032 RepID=A0A2K2FJN1_9CLOT|nr:sensor histidine kinase [Pseudoclostridium thermosuccinogenes]AUS98486.1 hypothetical protein CDO33_19725 [Pseudoclostridium thermosuccinogenes]PNT97061.1 hypothetical protein CDQ85_09460 [Pseudoclostridium thermosuccinogenes]PNT98992.1 hypothetical protein CDQ84_09610 [Pseudoclostridium thermosuccinogenes]